jgi:hypothetical protein
MDSPPVTVGRYEVREPLARGGMGMLYLAFDPAMDRPVALKVLRLDSADHRDRLLREARLAARLQHPNIVTVFDVGSHEGHPFIAMEFIAGETLAEIVGRKAPLSLARRIALMEQLCVGLGYAHRHGIVHCDVKPANLMVSRDSGILKVLDFGVAGKVETAGLDRSGMLMGTPNYMSPEQVVGQPADQRSDVFAVGLVLYELVSYRQAFTGDSQQAILLKVLHESPEPLASLVPGLDPALPAIVNRALEKSPDARYADLEAMRSDLSRVTQRLHQAESAQADPGRGTPAARGRGRARDHRRPARAIAPIAPAPPPAVRREPSVEEALAAAERDAYEGRFTAAIKRLETLGSTSPDVTAALARYRVEATKPAPAIPALDAAPAPGGLADVVRTHVVDVRTAMRDGRWADVRSLLQALERQLPESAAAGSVPPQDPSPVELTQDDEVNRFLRRARQRIEAGDAKGASELLDSVLNMTVR